MSKAEETRELVQNMNLSPAATRFFLDKLEAEGIITSNENESISYSLLGGNNG